LQTDRPGWEQKAKLGLLAFRSRVLARLVEMLRRLLFHPLRLPGDEGSVRRILVFRFGHVGDIVVAVPTLDAIRRRFPDAHICLLTSPGNPGSPGAEDLIRPGSLVDSLMVYFRSDIATWSGRRRLAGRIRDARFDLYVEIPDVRSPFRKTMQSMGLARVGGCRYAVGFRVTVGQAFPRTQALYGTFERESERLFHNISSALDLKRNAAARLPVSEKDRAAARKRLLDKGVSEREEIVVLHAGGKRPANRWLPERFAALADWIQTDYRMRAVFTGVEAERDRKSVV